MSDTQLLTNSLSVGALLPLVTAVVQQPHWSDRLRTLVGLLVSLLAGGVTYFSTNGFHLSDPTRIISAVLGTTLAAGASYKTIWKTSGVTDKIEQSTSPQSDPQDPDEVDEADAPDPTEEDDMGPMPLDLIDLETGDHDAVPARAAITAGVGSAGDGED
jgi:hypothetical protein